MYGVGIKEEVYQITEIKSKCLVRGASQMLALLLQKWDAPLVRNFYLHLFKLLKEFSHNLTEKVIRYH